MNKIANSKKHYSLLLTFFIFYITTFAQQKQKPNIMLILTDDAGYADFSFQSNRLIPTPNIDRIANEGAKFTDGYKTGSVCSSSRAGILTGVNQAEFGHIHDFVRGVKYTIPVDSFGLLIHEKLVAHYLHPRVNRGVMKVKFV